MKQVLIFCLSLILSINSFSQGYEIPVKINNLKDSMIYFGNHFGNGFFVNDSAKLDNNGQVLFTGDEPLKGGIYFLFLPGGKYFDFLIDKHQKFSIQCDTTDFLNTVSFKNSFQNEKFFNYQKYLNKQYQTINQIKEKQKTYLTKLDSLMQLEDEVQLIHNKIYLRKEEIISDHPDSLISVLIKAGIPIIPPPSPRDTSGAIIDSTFEYRYVKAHFFDNIDFSDERLLRTAILQNKVLEYLNRMAPPMLDSIAKEVDYVVKKASANPEVYKFVLNTLFRFYNKSNIISDENIFVYIAENYYLAGKTPWTNEEFTEKLKKDIAGRKPNLIDAVAPDFAMKNDKNQVVNLRDIQNRYVILYFYDVKCEICKQVSPELMNFYRIIKDRGVDIVGIYVGEDKNAWLKYIEDNNLKWTNVWDPKNASGFRENYKIVGTPQLFLLDEDQKIIAKRITVEQLMGYFNSVD